MADVMIRTVGIGKRYYRGLRPTLLTALRSGVSNFIKSPSSFSDFSSWTRGEDMAFWAVKDVSLELKRGDCLGFLGFNGSGKSTLMRMMCGITRPTAGYAEIYGRAVMLGGMGLGMNPELTGRENIFVNGAIMGEKRSTLIQKFDEIVQFAELERFIDTPAKFYSTGMFSRLAFSVAAHVRSDILVLDEVLLAGDWNFQLKCVNKIRSIAESEGRTVILCSHAVSQVRSIVRTCILLENGRMILEGPVNEMMELYVDGTGPLVDAAKKRREELSITPKLDFPKEDSISTSRIESAAIHLSEPDFQEISSVEKECPEYEKPGDELIPFDLRKIAVTDINGNPSSVFHGWDKIKIKIEYDIHGTVKGGRLQMAVISANGLVVFAANDHETDNDLFYLRNPGSYQCDIEIPDRWLSPGRYFIEILITNHYQPGEVIRFKNITFRIMDSDLMNTYYEECGERLVLKPFLKWVTSKKSDCAVDGARSFV